ncbi:hypothetical protein BN1723_007004 [Verticillium longisporum]|uniref:FZ domain-containing protein n=1 Tax=Verticillium longisporum TaxID=100787 RepID=A0A0G4NIV5_VERLO|nr:hypothetical protein BN1723_007004 [Verticillium longisporum]
MQFTPLQSRLVASLGASVMLLLLYFLLLSPGFAQAQQLADAPGFFLDERYTSEDDLVALLDDTSKLDITYKAEFPAFDRSIIGRAPPGVTGLLNNVKENRNVRPGTTQQFVFEASRIWPDEVASRSTVKTRHTSNLTLANGPPVVDDDTSTEDEGASEDLGLRRRQERIRTIYISATTCIQPQRSGNNTSMDPPQISLFVSTSLDNQLPGADKPMVNQTYRAFDEGAVMLKLNATGDVFFGISAPTSNEVMFDGEWNFDVAVSTDDFYHSYGNNQGGLLWVDSDSSAALLITPNMTDSTDAVQIQKIMDEGPQYVMFVENEDGWKTRGVRHSMCGLSNYAQMAAKAGGSFGDKATTVMTTRGPGGLPKQQFYFNGLNASSSYNGYLVWTGSESLKRQTPNRAGGGGRVFQSTQFETKSGDNCKIITDLTFCNETEYAVPANDQRFDIAELARFYDDYARKMYGYFERQLAQVACEAPSHQLYSLARDCRHCEVAYKKWLCSITIPRCEDISGTNEFSFVRNLNQSFPNGTKVSEEMVAQFPELAHLKSRNDRIDEEVAPGPYREILPCEDLCYDLVRNCPSSLGFKCPRPRQHVFNSSYQIRGEGLTCNYPGSVHNPSGSSAPAVSWLTLSLLMFVAFGRTSA